jgi:hypothetical protein
MLFCSLLDFGTGCIIALMCPLMGCIIHHFRFPDLADSVLARLRLLLADLLEVHCLRFRRILAFLPPLIYVLLLFEA